ncbi:hypothetical protein Ddye_030558 [Dipteronia dyeriana]|uniref:NPH3 domain-containing protein n=1 Tax=Dipteronia dyeriana TaxID=168575 RepID=A0AAD9THA6_9ROSI|nr:hypothetical protein Ddye_030558 [Dipteronia dyeriana]
MYKAAAMSQLSADTIQIHMNAHNHQTFLLYQHIVSKYSRKLKKKMMMINQDQNKTTTIDQDIINNHHHPNYPLEMDDHEFPGGSHGFELFSRFCYNNGGRIKIKINVSNVSLLHCCSLFLGMQNLLQQTESFLQDMFYWSWNDILTCLKSCESFVVYADSCGLLQNLISALLAQNSDLVHLKSPPSSSNYSAETSSNSSSSESINKQQSSSTKSAWWFDDLIVLPPKIIEKIIKRLGSYGTNNNSLILTKFLLHYLKRSKTTTSKSESYGGLANTAVNGVISVGKSTFSCRKLLWALRVVGSGFGLSKECRACLEKTIGEMLDEATLDDLMVSAGHHYDQAYNGGVYDVNLVLRLIRIFVNSSDNHHHIQRMKKVGRLIDKYLSEISPDHNLNISKFVGVAQSLPDFARDCFDGMYTAIDIYLQSHPRLSLEERSKLCRCLNYEKLSLEACKELAKNHKIPPKITIEALISQHSKGRNDENMSLGRMQSRVVALEEACRDIKGHQMLHAPPTTTLVSTFPTTFC